MMFLPRIEPMKAHVAPSIRVPSKVFPERMEIDYELDKYEGKGWCAQEKLDGTHIIVIKNGTVSMMSRSWKNDFAPMYPEIAAELSQLPDNTILDAELVFYRKDDGKPEFVTALATPETKAQYDVKLMLFDELNILGYNVEFALQKERITFVESLCRRHGWKHISPIPTVRSGFSDFYKRTIENGGEGIMLKKLDSMYVEGTRSSKWLKAKRVQTDDCVVLGLATGENKFADIFGALVVGQIVDGNMKVVARVSGMTDAIRNELNTHIRALPFDNSGAFWKGEDKDVFHKIAPGMVVEVEFMERTDSGKMRHPRFVRVRDDKPWSECVAQLEE
jgi:bifunctional non-homologous end joining protein LigD